MNRPAWSRPDSTELVLGSPVHGGRIHHAYGWLRGELYRRTRDTWNGYAEPSWAKADAASRDRLAAIGFLCDEATPEATWILCEEPRWRQP